MTRDPTWGARKLLFAGQNLLSQLSIRYQQLGAAWEELQAAGGVIETGHTCYADVYQATDEKKQLFTPVGSFLCSLLEILAWRDTSLRPFAEYFILADVLGSGRGRGRVWPLTVLSGEVVEKLKQEGYQVVLQELL